jgi:hypothetical protein
MKRLQDFNPMKTLCILLVFCIPLQTRAQEIGKKNNADFILGNGLNFSFNQGKYQFNLGGFIQPSFLYEKESGAEDGNEFNAKRSFLQFSGKAEKEKVSFLFQLDYSLSEPLLDAWLAYHPSKSMTITVGQKQSFVNNREMTYREDRLQFNNRSFLSQNLSNTGREFGLFLDAKFGKNFGIVPMLALTSGDGRNSFGSDARDSDLGGVKIGGRLDLYPLGYFKQGNDLTSTDLEREENIKFVLGMAASQNNGASSASGEGHGDFLLYEVDGNTSLPDYAQIYADFLLKYQGFSVLAEYANTSASNIDQAYLDANGAQILAPQQISEFLYLGDSFNVQAGYVTLGGLSFDARYESASPEFESNASSRLQDMNAFTFGVSKYFQNNSLKVQAAYTSMNPSIGNEISQFEVLFQIAF